MNDLVNKREEIIKYLQDNPLEFYWDYRDQLTDEQVSRIFQDPENIYDIESEIWINSFEYMYEYEIELIHQMMEDLDLDPDIDYGDIREEFVDFIIWNMDIEKLMNNTPDKVILVKVLSNYDCTNSTDDIDEPENYISEVWKRVYHAIDKKDYLREFHETYTATLLVFPVRMSVKDILELSKDMKETGKFKVLISKGTQFGFFSSFNGSGSIFESYTKSNLILSQDEWDGFDIILDHDQAYSIDQTYGGNDFISDGYIEIIKEDSYGLLQVSNNSSS